jgi:sporulation protein YlmC with PRC-barrel domain
MRIRPALPSAPPNPEAGAAPADEPRSVLLHLLGEPIVDAEGHRLGAVDDLLIDPETGCIAYAVMAWGGFMGRGEKQLVLPWRALSRDAARSAYVLDIDERRLAAAPSIDAAGGSTRRSHEWHLAVHRHYNALPYWH